MSDSRGSGGRALTRRSASFSVIAGVSAVIAMQWLPALSFLFAVPLFAVFYAYGRRHFALSLSVALACGALSSFVAVAAFSAAGTGSGQGSNLLDIALMGSFAFLAPLFFVALPDGVRMRFRVSLAAIATTLAFAWLFLLTPVGRTFDGFLRDFARDMADMFAKGLPEGFERDSVAVALSADSLYESFRDAFSFSFLLACLALYASCAWVARSLVSRFGPAGTKPFRLAFFYVEPIFFYPLVVGMCGIIADRFAPGVALKAISWNLFLFAGFFFVLQGIGILAVLTAWLRAKKGIPPILVFAAVIAACAVGWVYVLGLLLIAGVTELFVPMRARLFDKDVVDPTPGNGAGKNR